MRWRLCCLLVITITVCQTHAKPQIEDATFSETDLVAEESQSDGIYVAAPSRIKRAPQFFGNNFIYNTNSGSGSSSSSSGASIPNGSSDGDGCEGHNIFGRGYNNHAYSYGQNSYNGDAGESFPSYTDKQQETVVVMVTNLEHRNDIPSSIIVSHEHQSSNPSTPAPSSSSFNAGGVSNPPSFAYSLSPQYNHDTVQTQPPPQQQPLASQSYYDYSSGFYYYPPRPPPPGFYGYRPYGFYPHPPFGGPHGFGPPPFGGHPGFNHRRPPLRPQQPPALPPQHLPHGTNSFLNPVETTPTTMRPLTNIPESTQEIFYPNPTSSIQPPTTTTIAPTTEPTYDIDIRFGSK